MTQITSAFAPKLAVNDWMSNPMTDTQRLLAAQDRNKDLLNRNTSLAEENSQLKEAPWSKDTLAGAAGLGAVLLQAAALPDQLKAAKTQRKAMQQNIAFAKEEQNRRNRNIAGFNTARPTSAFAQGGV